VLASTFFAGINVGADTAAKQALDQALASVPVDFYVSAYYTLSSENVTSLVNSIRGIQDVLKVDSVSRAYVDAFLPGREGRYPFRLVGVSQDSSIYDGWTNAPASIEENKTYALAGSSYSKLLKQGDVIQVNMSMPYYNVTAIPSQQMTTLTLAVNLTVAGFAQLDNKASAVLQGQYYSYDFGVLLGFGGQMVYQTPGYVEDILIVDLEKTFAKFMDAFHEYSQPYSQLNTDILVYVDRDALISVWDIQGSLQRLEVLRRKIENEVNIIGFGLYVSGTLQSVLSYAQFTLSMMRLVFVGVSLPVFFVAWYMGTTVSDVSFNLRRREIGLLLTKGFSKSQLFRMFLSEALLLGLVGGFMGIALSLALNPLFIRAVGGEFTGAPVIGPDTAVMTVAFGVVLIVLAVFRPARRASNLSTVDALREYMYVEEVKPYRKRWPWVAFILGTYKLIILALGINLMNEVTKLAMGGNFLLIILFAIWASFDFLVLTYIGPVLFFWGFTKIFIRGSLKFQEITAKAARFVGDLGSLATRNVQRNPARAAAVAFLIALIIGYGVQITGTLASDQDYNARVVYASVGADVRIDLVPPINATAIKDLIKSMRANVSEVVSTAAEYSFYGTSSYFGGQQLLAVNTTEWPETAYYENGWFSGNDIKTAFQHMSSNNYTIILDRDIAERNSLHLNDKVRVSLGYERFPGENLAADLTIVGFYGVRRPDVPIFGSMGIYSSWSYVPQGLFHELGQAIANSSTARLLVRLSGAADGAKAAEQIRTFVSPRTATVYSVAEQLQRQQRDPMSTGTLNVQRLGVAFAIVAASVGTALVTFISLKERQREASMMSVRGLSFKQLTTMLLTENLAIVTFAVLLGLFAGLVIVYGNTVSFSAGVQSLVSKRLVFPTDALLTILIYCVSVFIATILPVMVMSKRYVSRLERIVRQA